MKCKTCNETRVIKINKPERVKLQCINGHTWFEDYTDRGGPHHRPASYEIRLEDILFPGEKILYKKILKHIEKKPEFYNSSNPYEITETLLKSCDVDEKTIYQLFKKIVDFQKIKDDY